jgi:hypothetical protein
MNEKDLRVGRVFRSLASAVYKYDEFQWEVMSWNSTSITYRCIKGTSQAIGQVYYEKQSELFALFGKSIEWADAALNDAAEIAEKLVIQPTTPPISTPSSIVYPPEFWSRYTGRKTPPRKET